MGPLRKSAAAFCFSGHEMATDRSFRSWAPLAYLADIPAEAADVETELDIAELAPQEQVGGAGKFDFSPVADAMVAEHARDSARGYHPPLVLGHDATDKDAAVGWVTGLRRVGTRLRASVRLLADFARDVKAGKHRFVSPEIRTGYRDQLGAHVAAKLLRVAVTHTPHQKGHADGGMAPAFALTEMPAVQASEHKGTDMTEQEVQALVEKNTQPLVAQLAEAKETATKLAEKVTALETAAGEKDATIKALSDKAIGLERGAKVNAIREVVRLGDRDCKFTPAILNRLLPGYAADPVKALEDSKLFCGNLSALAEWVATAPVAVDLGGRISLAGDPNATADDAELAHRSKVSGVPVEYLKAAAEKLDRQAS